MMRVQQPFAELDAAAFASGNQHQPAGCVLVPEILARRDDAHRKGPIVIQHPYLTLIFCATPSKSTVRIPVSKRPLHPPDELMASARAADSENAVEAEPHPETRPNTNRNS